MNTIQQTDQRISSILGRVGYQAVVRRGRDTENRVMWAFENATVSVPLWFGCIDRASREQDLYRGIDFVVETRDMGKIYLQVKSSQIFAQKFRFKQSKRRYNKYIAVVVLDENTIAADAVCDRVISAVSKIRNKLLALRK